MDLMRRHLLAGSAAGACLGLAGCASLPGAEGGPRDGQADTAAAQVRWLNRLTWGATPEAARQLAAQGLSRWLAQQLKAQPGVPLPPEAQAQIEAMTITREPLVARVVALEAQRRAADALKDDEAKKAAQQAYQQELNRQGRESAQRFVLRALYSPQQVQEQMVWFWMNHFSLHLYKGNLRALIPDFEDQAVRPHALGRFRDLLGATVYHPAMLRYLDNEHNAAGRLNENYARELMELHTLGVGGGYSQQDVQALARVLSGLGVVNPPDAPPPQLPPALQGQYVRRGLFEFNPRRHDDSPQSLLGQPLPGRGLARVEAALDRLARHPSTARFVARKLVLFWVSDTPAPGLVDRVAAAFQRSDGDIAATLNALFSSPEFAASLGTLFRDPVHYVLAGVRLAYDGRVILNPNPVLNWINRLGEPLYGRSTPDGYPLEAAAWSSAGQMSTRFEVARAIGSGPAGLFKTEATPPVEQPAFPQLSNALYHQGLAPSLSPRTRQALEQASSPQEWNTFLLSSPEFMNR
ncbi:MAG: DUF1800 family protein [Curvibacter lanceolatus]|uniref:DUF1800 domain-containing protein n=1 Tax=Curvibacter lanceolatus TaxID=86182 RepID=UPI002357D2A1|nr:DUF1800 family protein [Curvibacter lanceolatus]MBV5291913.1 DUF1800 family protein [Curvibacter lanceolatus]